MLLTAGRVIFDGNVDGPAGMSEYFKKVGYPMPHETNPADHVMFLMQVEKLARTANALDTARTLMP